MNKAPAFQFYVNEWLGSTKIALMTPAQEGGYIRLLAVAWNAPDCGLPDDDTQLARLSRLGDEWLNGASTLVRECFFSKSGRLFNQRLLCERKKQAEWRKKSAIGGRRSAKTRAKARREQAVATSKGGMPLVGVCLQPNGNTSPSPSPSPSSPSPKVGVTTPPLPPRDCGKPVDNLPAKAIRGWTTERFQAVVLEAPVGWRRNLRDNAEELCEHDVFQVLTQLLRLKSPTTKKKPTDSQVASWLAYRCVHHPVSGRLYDRAKALLKGVE